MRKHFLGALAATFLFPASAFALPEVGAAAPSFSVKDIDGHTVKTSDLKGKTVVLEWNNPTCPFVHKQYDTNTMQKLQADATGKGVVWLTINSGSEGKVGTVDAKAAHAYMEKNNLASTHYILDTDGTIGRLYGAKTTPHMFVIDKDGKVAYMGAIDNGSSPNPATVEKADNYVRDALDDLAAGKAVKVSSTQSYGCGVKYAD